MSRCDLDANGRRDADRIRGVRDGDWSRRLGAQGRGRWARALASILGRQEMGAAAAAAAACIIHTAEPRRTVQELDLKDAIKDDDVCSCFLLFYFRLLFFCIGLCVLCLSKDNERLGR